MTVALDSSQLTLAELAAIANREHAASLSSTEDARRLLSQGVVHAIAAGDALLAAKERVPAGEWMRWVEQNVDMNYGSVTLYCRLAKYQKEIMAADQPLSMGTVAQYLRDEGIIKEKAGRSPWTYPDSVRKEAQRLHTEGVGAVAIAELLDVSAYSVRTWIDPEVKKHHLARQREYNRERNAVRLETERKQREDVVKRNGGKPALAYSLLQRAVQLLEEAEAKGDTAKRLESARKHAARARKDIERAVGARS